MLKYNFRFLRYRGGGCLCWVHADKLAGPAFFFKLHDAIYQGEQSIVLASAHVFAWFPTRAALAGQNVAAQHTLAAKFLEAEPLRIRVSSIPRGAYAFFMSHLLIFDLRLPICDFLENSDGVSIKNLKSKI